MTAVGWSQTGTLPPTARIVPARGSRPVATCEGSMTLDPTRALAQIRAAVHEIHKLTGVSDDPLAELADHLATLIEGLDGYLAAGGFVPDQWLPTRMAMLQAEYRRGFEAAMLVRRHERLQVPAAPIHYAEPLGPPNPADAEHVTFEDVVESAKRLNEQTRERIRARGEDPDEVIDRALRGLKREFDPTYGGEGE